MKKVKLLLYSIIACFAISCGDNSPLKQCANGTEKNSGTKADEYCGDPVSVEAFIKTLENTSGQEWTCTKK